MNVLRKTAMAAFACVCSISLYSQGKITGKVSDESGASLSGVSVVIKGSNVGVLTDVNGNYSISVTGADNVLVFSLMGFATQETGAGGRTVINVTLVEESTKLEEVVVVGYGTQKKANLTSAIGTASGKVLENRPITTVGEGLQGIIPNLQITPGGTAPGQGASFNIRGYTSLNGGSPLVLVDGVVQDPNLVNPGDIESVSVLKDAASAAVYGARAAYGVILLTTKSGKKNQKPVFNVSASWAGSSPIHLQHSMSALDYVNLMNLSAKNSGQGAIFDERQIGFIKKYNDDPVNNLPVYYDPTVETDGRYGYCGNTDWADVLYKNGGLQNYNISMSGGSENTQYFISYGLLNQQGILAAYDDKYQRHTINMDLTTDINRWLTFGGKVRYTYGYEDHPSGGMSNSGLGAYTGVLKADLPPFMPIRHPDGNYAGQGSITNPFAVGELGGYDQRRVNDLWVTGKITLHPLKGWNIYSDFTFNPYSWNQERVVKPFYEKRADGSEYIYPWVKDHGVTRSNANDYYTAVNVYTDYFTNIGKNNFKVTLGYNQEIKINKSFNAVRLGLINKDTPMLSLSTGTQTVGDNATSWAVQGVFGRLHYDYAEKYLIDINGRYDGSSRFAKGHRFALFPSVSAAWYISREDFMESISHILNDLKIRGSYGSLGNQTNDNNFLYVPGYSIDTNQGYIVDGGRGVAVTAPGLVSASLTWEKVTQWNAAVDFGFLQNRLNGSFDFFTRSTIGMLVSSQPLPGVLGTGAPQANAADLKTVGWELTLKWDDRIENIGLDYHASFVLSDALAEITKYRNPTGSLGSYYVGRKIGEIWGYESNGLFQSVEEIAAAPSQNRLYNGTWNPGDVRYVDKNGDGEISNGDNTLANHGDISIIGNTTPRYQYGVSLGAAWKGFDLDIFLQGVGKRNWNPDGRFFGVNGRWDVPARDIESYWTEENHNGFLPRQYQESRGNRQTNTRYLQNAAYLRFKQFSLGYTLPAAMTRKVSIEKVRVYFTGQNMFTWTKLSKLYDPEIIGTAGRDTGVASNMTYPVARTFSFGLNVTF
ncbi:MAG: TonB-dependent receptor [Prevotellaceae bacterium]|jgi:TonB-linked SusC/RagA family outer membrane protein|nr:TonB-dependent receptor [Prevotellaceae bacterium]